MTDYCEHCGQRTFQWPGCPNEKPRGQDDHWVPDSPTQIIAYALQGEEETRQYTLDEYITAERIHDRLARAGFMVEVSKRKAEK
jgi:hypothetical protein